MALFAESADHYAAERYTVAAALLEEAYALHPEPILLYNLGRAREAAEDPRRALEAYRAYLEAAPDSEQAPKVTAIVEVLEEALSAKAQLEEPSVAEDTAGAPKAPAAAPPVNAPAPSKNRGLHVYIGGALTGAGGATLGAALGMGLAARARHQKAVDEPVQVDAQRIQKDAERKALIAGILAAGGGALALGGVTWLWVNKRRERNAKPAARATRTGWSLRWYGTGIETRLRF